MYLTGQVDKRIIDKFEKEAKRLNRDSWFLAFIMDINDEERAKGKTVEVGRAHFATEKRRYTILDAPGHKNYLPNMIAGAAQADVGVLVISARRGEFETGFDRGGQTREHALLAKTLGVRQLVVVINKMDNKTVKWSKERFDHCKKKLDPFLKASGFNTKKYVHYVPLSALTGEGVMVRAPPSAHAYEVAVLIHLCRHQNPIPTDVCPWYKGGLSLLQQLDKLKISGRDSSAPVVLPVLDRYTDRGLVVMGKVEAGTVRAGLTLKVMPTGKLLTIDSVSIDDEEVEAAQVGENVNLKVKGVNEEDIHRGCDACLLLAVYCLVSSMCAVPGSS